MASLFVSHSSRDRAAIRRVVEQLAAEGFSALFIDFDPAHGIPAGRSWERELYAQLRKTDGVIFVASAASVASQWCFAEVSLARSLGKPVFPLRLEAGVRLALLDDVQWVDLTDGDLAFVRLRAGLQRAGLDEADKFTWDPSRSPYPGLESFTVADAAVFFGREQEIDRLLELLQPTLRHGAGRFVAIVGPSGSGKSSLLRAGVLPRLDRLKACWVLLSPLVPGQQPTRNLARSLAAAFAAHGHTRPLAELETSLNKGSGGLVELAAELAEAAGDASDRPNVLVVVDQAEELLTRSGVREQQTFLSLLDGALRDDSPIWVVATVRSEFLSTAPERAGLAEAIDDAIVVEPLSRARLPDVIQRPAQRAGLDFDPGLVERMVEETTGGDALPLLAYALRELYHRARSTGRITAVDYEAMGGVVGALRRRADRLLDELTRRGRGQLVLPALMKLASVDDEGEPTRRRLRRDLLDADQEAVVQAFVDARLLITDEVGHQAIVEVAHEALLRQWPPLRHAIEASRESLRMRSELERLAADWDQGNRDESYLLRGGRLSAFDDWAEGHAGELSPLERQYLHGSQVLARRELLAARRSNQRLRRLVAGLGVLVTVAVVLMGLAISNNRQAQAQAHLALSRQLAVQANELAGTEPDTAVLLGLQSLSLARDAGRPQPPAGLVTGLARLNHVSRRLSTPGAVWSVALSPDGKLLAAGVDQTVQLWDVATGRPHGPPFTGHTSGVRGVAFSPDGKLLASASTDETVRLWDVATGHPRGRPLTGHNVGVFGVAFSPDGKLLAAGDLRTVRMWDVATGRPHGGPLTGHTSVVAGVAFSPDGKLLASASGDQTVRMWDVATGRPHGPPLIGHTDVVNGVAFSPDGKLLASASWDRTVLLWDVPTGRPHGWPLTGHTDAVHGVAFSPDGKLLASAGQDETVRLWDVSSGERMGLPLIGHSNAVEGLVFSSDGKLLASASSDHTIRLWQVAATYTISQPLIGHNDVVYRVAFSPDGKLLASASRDQTVRMWDVATGRPHGPPLTGHTKVVHGVAFSPDGKLLASTGGDGVRLWNLAIALPDGQLLTDELTTDVAFSPDGNLLASANADQTVGLWDVATRRPHGPPLTGHTDVVRGVAFSPDGKLLASAGDDKTVRLWDVATGQPHGRPLTGHTSVVNAVSFSLDGRLLASVSGDQTVRLWDVATGQPHGSPLTSHKVIHGVAFSPDGKLLAAGDFRTVRLWDVATGQPHDPPFTGHTNMVHGVAFSPDGKLLASSSSDGTVRFWHLDTSLVAEGCRIVDHNLSKDQWEQFAQGLPYQRTCSRLPAGEGAPRNAPAAHY